VLRSPYNGTRNAANVERLCQRRERRDFDDVLELMRFTHALLQREGRKWHQAFLDLATMPSALFD